jgi:glycosyltransferase involved in cell wall biosynthesis
MPKVSVIVPIYNVEKYLDRCMESLLNQTLEDIEIIMVDDGSPDNCPQMCDEYAKKDSRVKVVHKKNAGLGFARNSGLDIATGEYVAFVDSDDYIVLDMYKTLYERAEADKCDAVFCGFRTEVRENKWVYSDEVDADTLWKGKDVKQFMLNMIASGAGVKAERLYQMSVWHSIYKRLLIDENHLRFVSEREVASEDIPFQVDFLSKANTVAYVSKTFYSYCLNGTSLTATLKPEKYARYKQLRTCLLSKSSHAEYVSRVNRLFIGYTRSHLYDIINSTWKHKEAMIKEIQSDDIWKEIRHCYSPANLPFVSKSIYVFLLSASAWLLYLLVCLMNAARKRSGGGRF